MDIEKHKPLYSIAVAAELSGSSARMLREYEKAGFIKPARVNGQRRYSNSDIEYIKNVLFYLEKAGMTITGLKILYMMAPCWEIKQCGKSSCPAYGNFSRKCWETISESGLADQYYCEGCSIYLTYQKNKDMQIHQEKAATLSYYDPDQAAEIGRAG